MKVRMQRIFIFILLFFQLGMVKSFSQKVAIENLKQNIAYPINHMNIVVEEIPCDEIFVSTNNGEIKSNGDCKYIFLPHEIGIASIFIHKIEKGDTVQFKERIYRVKSWPKPGARLSGQRPDKMEIGEFKAQRGIRVPFVHLDFGEFYKVKSFRFRVIRGKKLVGETLNLGGRFESKAKDLILKVEIRDRIIFDEIEVYEFGSSEVLESEGLDFKIK